MQAVESAVMRNLLALFLLSLFICGCGGSGTDVQVATGGDGVQPQLRFLSQPSRAGEPLTSFQVGLFDPLGTLIPTSGVEITISSPNATLQGDLTRTTVNGIATFDNVRSNTARTDTLLVASATGFSSTESTRFVVEANDAATLLFFSTPAEQSTGDNVAFSVQVTDSFGNPVNNVAVTADLLQNGTNTSLLNAQAMAITGQNGIATFNQLSPNQGGQMFVRLTSGTLTLDSAVFTVTVVIGRDWRFIQSSPLFNDNAFGNGTFVIGGTQGAIRTSTDGLLGTAQDLGSTGTVTGLTFGNNLFVATVGNRIRTSPDGVTWTDRTGGAMFFGVTFGGGRFVAVGGSGRIFSSDDGITWTQRTSGTTGPLFDVTHDGTRFVAVGASAVVTSADGITWTAGNFGAPFTGFAVTSGNGLLVASGNGGQIFTSPDGVTWTSRAAVGGNYRGVAFSGSTFVATGSDGDILSSADGITWVPQTSGTTLDLRRVRFINGLFRTSARGLLLASADGVTWTSSTTGAGADDVRGMVSGNGIFLGVGGQDGHIRSTDGENWSLVNAGLPFLFDVTFGNNQFVAVGVGRDVVRSADGLNWTRANNALPPAVYSSVDFVNGFYVTTGTGGALFSSTDAINWTQRNTMVTGSLLATAFGNGTYVTVGASGNIITSPDLVTWTTRTSGVTQNLNAVTFANGIFVVVGNSGTVLTSSDGQTWTAQTNGTAGTHRGVIFASGFFTAVGDAGSIITSTDGATWTSSVSNTQLRLNDITFDSGMLVAGGTDAGIVKSP